MFRKGETAHEPKVELDPLLFSFSICYPFPMVPQTCFWALYVEGFVYLCRVRVYLQWPPVTLPSRIYGFALHIGRLTADGWFVLEPSRCGSRLLNIFVTLACLFFILT